MSGSTPPLNQDTVDLGHQLSNFYSVNKRSGGLGVRELLRKFKLYYPTADPYLESFPPEWTDNSKFAKAQFALFKEALKNVVFTLNENIYVDQDGISLEPP